MKILDPIIEAEVESNTAYLATCWKITRTDNVVLGFTDHDVDIVFDSVTYEAETGFNRSALAQNSTLAVDNMDLEGAVASIGISEEDVRDGIYDYAEVEVFQVNINNPTAKVILKRGLLGNLTLRDGIYVTEIRGLSQMLSRTFVELILPDCNAEVYDSRCTVNPAAFTNTGSVSAVITQRQVFTVSLNAPARSSGYFTSGLITFTSGLNNGKSMDVKSHEGDDFTMFLNLSRDVAMGDTFSVQRGCHKRFFKDCIDVFDNGVNFRGYPKVPGQDKINKYPNYRSPT